MNKRNLPHIFLSAIIICSLTACNKFTIPFFSGGSTGNSGSSSENSTSSATLPTDREKIHSNHNDSHFSSRDLDQGAVSGDWAIIEVNGEPLNPDLPAYLKFVTSEKRVYGNNGCNTLNASYEYSPEEHKLIFSNMLSTMRLCNMQGVTDEMINLALNNTRTYSWDHTSDEYFLHFYDETGRKIMTLEHQTFEFLNGSWKVSKIEDETINDPDMRIIIDIAERRIHGNTGCNILNGLIDIDMETANTIAFHDIIVTQMECHNPENQTRLIVALEDVAHARPLDDSTVVLTNLLNRQVLTIKRL